jgi:glycine hydroxymethyltransferase
MSLDAGGHLTHGAKPNQSGKWFNAIQYGVRQQDLQVDYDQIAELTAEHKPKMIIAGGSAIPRIIDFAKMREIADSVGAYLLVDMAHFAGLVASGHYPSPFPHAHVATTTTHKTLRGPRGGMILTNDEEMAKKVNSAIFPGIQGGPLMHVIAAKAVAFGEALRPGFKDYQAQVIANAQALADQLMKGGLDIVTGGTDTHLMLVDLRPKGVKGNATEKALGRAHITCNKNGIPFDTEKADDHLRRAPRLARRHHARLRRGGVPPDRRLDRRGGRRACRERRGRQRRDRGQGRGRSLDLCRKFPVYPNL